MKNILEYRLKVSAMLRDNDEARTAFNRETLLMEEDINRQCSNKCFNSFIAGTILTTIIFSGVFYVVKNNINDNILTRIEQTIKGEKNANR